MNTLASWNMCLIQDDRHTEDRWRTQFTLGPRLMKLRYFSLKWTCHTMFSDRQLLHPSGHQLLLQECCPCKSGERKWIFWRRIQLFLLYNFKSFAWFSETMISPMAQWMSAIEETPSTLLRDASIGSNFSREEQKARRDPRVGLPYSRIFLPWF